MPTFIIRYPEDQERKALISNLIGTLEKLNSLVVYDAICVVVQPGDPELELLKSLASGQVESLQVQAPAAPEFEADAVSKSAENYCEECGDLFVKRQVNSRYCSKKCGQRAYARKHRQITNTDNHKAKLVRKANGGFNDGSGVVHGKLTLGRNR